MLGLLFQDHIDKDIRRFNFRSGRIPENTELIPHSEVSDEKSIPSVWKRFSLKAIVLILTGILVTHVFTLQIIRGKYYQALAEGNGIVNRPLDPSRGVIADRNGVMLVRNTPYIGEDDSQLIPYKEFIQHESTLSAEQKKKYKIQPIREYQFENELSHILGYTSPITQEEIEKSKKLKSEDTTAYTLRDTVGRTGLEEEYEVLLRGKGGTEVVEVNALGEMQRVLEKNEPTPGYTLVTSIDSKLQKYVYTRLEEAVKSSGGVSGVAIVQDPTNGQILALANYPSFSNNSFTHPDKKKTLEDVFTNPATPLLNRAIGGNYPPGSTFKIVTALAGLESKAISQTSTYDDTGNITISGITFNNWYFTQYGKGEGKIDVVKAIARSNDTFFYKMALETGVEKLAEQANEFKFGQVLGVDIPGEAKGVVPTPEWKKEVKNEDWYPGNTVNMSIGQGDVLSTPLQISAMTATIANGGTVYPPTIVMRVNDEKNNKVCERKKESIEWSGKICESLNKNSYPVVRIPASKENIETIKEGMRQVNAQGGTAYPFFNYPIETAGKTGTAESFPGKPPHAWYTGFAPYQSPQITVTVLVEYGGEGSKVAAPASKDIMDFYFKETTP